ncbi:hypothetical protein [Gluconobacter wancherniae]|uniref:Uncharacterized protein n=1 Tax=Gluconobacter wancherniae NBRC 103581 TaxID=656744 RepID=A0A511B1S8_9PROT|nr:hypothetical protein [Gluconobacter wancherniae]MBF0853809.1 hypothetical protein [Gluconobacter wancherniae]MBS1064351.1 hypothetical protein [Gluconobacter wancherniae]MBS1095982.1 hypothetical protein [Gluconobacter wancherniae]GBR64717.1 hypothetical protein AA103581_1458 [Gluconobacter wancherniae NBRC 103581]GEK94368.1 hypothetical protein GWA01_21380 [Gluconobacter wancherniae NBRC 103581]
MSEQKVSSQENIPVDRLEEALTRIAFALDRQAQNRELERQKAAEGPDLQALAANLDAMCVRIRNIVGREGE